MFVLNSVMKDENINNFFVKEVAKFDLTKMDGWETYEDFGWSRENELVIIGSSEEECIKRMKDFDMEMYYENVVYVNK